MARGGKARKTDSKTPKKRSRAYEDPPADDLMDDEIDAFHKQRDVIPLDVNGDMDGSDEDNEHPVFDFKDANDEDSDDDEIEDDSQLTGLAAKIARQQKYLRAKIGGVEDDMHDDSEDEEEKKAVWGRRKNIYYNADNVDYEIQSSDEELPAEEEMEVLRLQKEKAKSLSMEDFGLEEDVSQSESDGEPTLEEISLKGKKASQPLADQGPKTETDTVYEEVKKDLDSLTREEQMDVVYSSAPELVGLLSELNDSLEQLEKKVNPLLIKVRMGKDTKLKGGMRYMEVKQLLLLAYCQAITFYLLLKSEGQPVRDHPVIARLVEIKNLLEKMKQLDENLPSEIEEILNEHGNKAELKLAGEGDALLSDTFTKDHKPSSILAQEQGAVVVTGMNSPSLEAAELVKVDSLKDNKKRAEKHKRQDDQITHQSMEMLKVRAALDEKLKQKGIFSSITPKHGRSQKHLQPVNGQLETFDDFGDDAINVEGGVRGKSDEHFDLHGSKLSQLVTPRLRKSKVVSGDGDLPMRDDIGERRRKHELRVLAGAGIISDDIGDDPETLGVDADGDDMEEDGVEESEDEFYKQVKKQRAEKLAAKAEIYSRSPAVPSVPDPETLPNGKRHITSQMEKNRGLTRARKKLIKNPRKKYKLKHEKAVVRRKGQVREMKRPTGPYGGETSGINAGISRSIRFKS